MAKTSLKLLPEHLWQEIWAGTLDSRLCLALLGAAVCLSQKQFGFCLCAGAEGTSPPSGLSSAQQRTALRVTLPAVSDLWLCLVAGTPELSAADRKELESKLKEREEFLAPIYQQVAVQFADLHDTPGRMQEKGVITVSIAELSLGAPLEGLTCGKWQSANKPLPKDFCHGSKASPPASPRTQACRVF